MMDTVGVIKRSYESVLSYRKREDHGRSRRSNERMGKTKRRWSYIAHERIRITLEGTIRASDAAVRGSATANSARGLAHILK